MNKVQKFIWKRKIRFLVKKISRLIYSDRIPFSTTSEQDVFIDNISNKADPLHLLITYLVIQFTTQNISYTNFYEPIEENTVNKILEEFNQIYKFSGIKELSKEYRVALNSSLDLNRAKVHRNLRLTSSYIVNGREAYEKNEYSFEGMRYIREKNCKKSLSLIEQKKCKDSAEEIVKLNEKVKEVEQHYDSAVSKLIATAALDRLVDPKPEEQKTLPSMEATIELLKSRGAKLGNKTGAFLMPMSKEQKETRKK